MHLLKTFLVEDSQLIRESLTATLEELGAIKVVGAAADQTTAVAWLNRYGECIDLVIVDIFLQGGSGLGVLRAFARLPAPPKVVVLSNFATHDMRGLCTELGADRIFDKSHDIEALVAYCTTLPIRTAAASMTANNSHCHWIRPFFTA